MKKLINILIISSLFLSCNAVTKHLEKNTQHDEVKSEKYVEETRPYRVNRDSTSISKMDLSSISIDIIPVHKKDND